MTKESILDKIKKLLALAKSDNVNEAASAASKAQALATRYQIDLALASLEAEANTQTANKPRSFTFREHEIYRCGRRMSLWVWQMACGVAHANHLKLLSQGGNILGYGEADDAEVARFLIGWLVGEVERLEKLERTKLPPMEKGESKRWGNSFRMACGMTIRERLEEAAETTRKKLMSVPTEDEYSQALTEWPDSVLDLDRRGKYSLALTNQENTFLDALRGSYEKRYAKVKPRAYGGTTSSGDGWSRGREAGGRANLGGKGLPGA